MSCLGYLCFVYDYCGSCTNKPDKGLQSKFYVTPNYSPTYVRNVLNLQPPSLIPRNPVETISHAHVVSKSCSSGDWTMRYSDSLNTTFSPYSVASKFDLVPWRQQKNRLDLMQTIGWEPPSPVSGHLLLRKHTKGQPKNINTKLTKQRIKYERKANRRQIKIRIVFSIEFNKKMKIGKRARYDGRKKCIAAANSSNRLNQQLFLVDEQQFQLCEQWHGYFSQRPRVAEDEPRTDENNRQMAVFRPNSAETDKLDYRLSFTQISQMYFKHNTEDDTFKQVPCAQCRKR